MYMTCMTCASASIGCFVCFHCGYTVGWVDIGTVARVPLRFVVYFKKSRENHKKFVFLSNRFSIGLGHTVQYTI
jgi:hypothetical protein